MCLSALCCLLPCALPAPQARVVTALEIAAPGPVEVGLPVPLWRPGERLVLRGARGERPLQYCALAPPVAGRQWLLLASEGDAGRFELRLERGPVLGAVPAATDLPACAALDPFVALGDPAPLPLAPWQTVTAGPLRRHERTSGQWGDVTVAVDVVCWRSGCRELRLGFTTAVRSLVTMRDLSLWLPRAAASDPQRAELLAPERVEGPAGSVRWVLATARGQAGFALAGDRIEARVLPRGTLLEAGEVLVVEFRCQRPGAEAAAAAPVAAPADRPPQVRVPAALWRQAGILPRGDSGRGAGARQDLATVALRAVAERRVGREFGGFQRGGGVWTNLEFDTTLALLRLEMAGHGDALYAAAWDSARHWAGRLLVGATAGDALAGLPFVHGIDTRGGGSETGHVWVTGALLLGLRSGDPLVLDAARRAADVLARAVLAACAGERAGRRDRARNLGWPLLELERLQQLEPRALWAQAADAAAADLLGRFDRTLGVFRFGESESERSPTYEEKLWLTGGIVLPALRAHVARRPEQRAARDLLRLAEAAHLARAVRGDGRIRSHLWLDSTTGAALGEGVPCDHARALFVLEGLPADAALPAALSGAVRRALARPVDPRATDPVTQLTMAARLDLVFR